MLTITHTAHEGTLIEGTSRNDGTGPILKANGWRWFPSIGMWGIRSSRDRAPKRVTINLTADALRAAGFEVTVEIDATARPAAEVEADVIARQADRVDALRAKADRKAADAEQAWTAERRACDSLPPGGEPIKVGHHSEGRHRRAIDKAHDALGRAVGAEADAKEAARRAETAAHSTGARYSPITVKNRLDKLEAEQRADQRLLDGHERTLYVIAGQKHVEITTPAQGAYRETVTARMAERAEKIAMWQEVRAEQLDSGTASNHGPDTIAKGDLVQWRGTWYPVKRVNKKTVTIPSIVGGSWTDTLGYHLITGHRRPGVDEQTATG